MVDTSDSPAARLQPFPLSAVRWTDGFWADRTAQMRTVTLRKLWDLAADPEAGHVLENMRIAAGRSDREYYGTYWQDAWLYKWIESAAAVYAVDKDPWLDQRMDEAIQWIAAAQQDDGYIATQVTTTGRTRFEDPNLHEVYTMGHLLTAACMHYRVTGKQTLLQVATRCADFLCGTLGVSVDPGFAHNPSAVMGLVDLYRVTGQRQYLDCAKLIVDRRGSKPKRGGIFSRPAGMLGSDHIQDRTPLRKSTEVVGHNVFFTYLYAGATDVYMETGDESLWGPLETLWQDLTTKKMCINGGVSPMGKGLSNNNDVVNEAVGAPYVLPNADSYNETCGQVGNLMWNFRMLCAKPDAKYADIMELELYNGFLAGIGLDGESWFYRNSLRRNDPHAVGAGMNDLPQRDTPGRRRICCPTNLLRSFAELQSYWYSVDDSGLWIHHYAGSRLDGRLVDDSPVVLTQKTDYPWDGLVQMELESVATASPFSLHLRIPGWAASAIVRVNGRAIESVIKPGSYLTISRSWTSGDTIELTLPMTPELMLAHPDAESQRNQVAVRRGPLLYCLESTDLPDGVSLSEVLIPESIQLRTQGSEDLPFGTLHLVGQALVRKQADWTGRLYRPLRPSRKETIPIRLIPYFAWSNRGPSAMSVWLPVQWND
ncbi:glycoside hydrolase family 127 protein [Crateriforma conspicua]|uniref:glycoside hydrolase family 127 protein n=1 Tax=Crateriforma TaxID=2714592 RepID=UPI0018CD8477|nr:beta-L-arabinofuranosidase domain-containing protein [Crateriforma conspicua]